MADKDFSVSPTMGAVAGFFGSGIVSMLAVSFSGLDRELLPGRQIIGLSTLFGGVLGYLTGRITR